MALSVRSTSEMSGISLEVTINHVPLDVSDLDHLSKDEHKPELELQW